jgi:hypothetical protein
MKLELIHIHDYELVNENADIIGKIYNKQDAEEIVRRVNEYEKIPELLEKQELRESACRLEVFKYYQQIKELPKKSSRKPTTSVVGMKAY